MEDNKTTITPENTEKEFVKSLIEAIAHDAKNGRNITLRTGKALEQHDPQKIRIEGVIDSPFKWLEKRKDTIDQKQCSVLVNRDFFEIGLRINEHDYFCDTIIGKLIISSEFKKFGINNGEYTTGLQLSDLIRMNRPSPISMKIISSSSRTTSESLMST